MLYYFIVGFLYPNPIFTDAEKNLLQTYIVIRTYVVIFYSRVFISKSHFYRKIVSMRRPFSGDK